MIKIFWGGGVAGVVTPYLQNPLSPTKNFCLYPPPVLRCFWKDLLMTPTTTPLSSIFHCYPSPHPPPLPPPENFNHATGYFAVKAVQIFKIIFGSCGLIHQLQAQNLMKGRQYFQFQSSDLTRVLVHCHCLVSNFQNDFRSCLPTNLKNLL